jgi:flavin reductase (DIM6/NTAB) family NADH-FMN oxidoreductase RutF
MQMRIIDPRELELRPIQQLLDDWMLLSAGDFDRKSWNAMTVAWGFIGAMWRRPVAITPVRSTRFTTDFMEHYDTWTLTAFPEAFRQDLQLLGTRSGRDGDKVGESALTPIAATQIASPTYREAILSIECRTVYWNDISPDHMRDGSLDALYDNDYHRMYYGEILAVSVTD